MSLFNMFANFEAPENTPVQANPVVQNQFKAYDLAQDRLRESIESEPPITMQAPEQSHNPFDDPMVMIGMALQNKSSEALVQGARIDQDNKLRRDRHRAQVFLAEERRTARKSALEERLLASEEREAGARIANDATLRREQATADQAEERNADRDADLALRQAQFDYGKERDAARQNAMTDFRLAIQDPKNPVSQANIGYETLMMQQRLGQFAIPAPDGSGTKIVDIHAPDTSPEDIKAAQLHWRRQVEGTLSTIRGMGFRDVADQYMQEVTALVANAEEVDKAAAASAAATGEGLTLAGVRQQERLEAVPGENIDLRTGDETEVNNLLALLDTEQQDEALTALAGQTMTDAQETHFETQARGREISAAVAESVQYPSTVDGVASIKGFITGTAAGFESQLSRVEGNFKEAERKFIEHLSTSTGVKASVFRADGALRRHMLKELGALRRKERATQTRIGKF